MNLEHPRQASTRTTRLRQEPFGNLGHRRVLVTANSVAQAKAWCAATGVVTHVSPQVSTQYGNPTVPVVSFKALTDR